MGNTKIHCDRSTAVHFTGRGRLDRLLRKDLSVKEPYQEEELSMCSTVSRRKLERKHRKLRRGKPKSWCFVYVLKEAIDSPPFYVGQTRCSLDRRLHFHLKNARQDRLSPCEKRVRELLEAGNQPIIEVIDSQGQWDISEAVWIDRLCGKGVQLLNVNGRVP